MRIEASGDSENPRAPRATRISRGSSRHIVSVIFLHGPLSSYEAGHSLHKPCCLATQLTSISIRFPGKQASIITQGPLICFLYERNILCSPFPGISLVRLTASTHEIYVANSFLTAQPPCVACLVIPVIFTSFRTVSIPNSRA